MMKKLRYFCTLLLMVVVSVAWADEETLNFSAQGYANQQEISTVEAENFSVTFNKGTNNNTPKYYTSGTAIRAYGGNYFTVTSENTITQIVITFGSSDGSNAITTNVGTYSNGTWTGSGNSVTFNVGGTSGNRRIASITVTYTPSGSSTTLEDNDLALTGAPVALTFDLYDNAEPQVINYTTSSTGAVTIPASNFFETAIDETNKTITVTPVAVTNGVKEATVNQAADDTYKAGSATFTVNITNSAPYEQPTEFEIGLNNALFGTAYTGSVSNITDANPIVGTQDNVTVTYAGSGNHYVNDTQIRFYPNNKLKFEAPEGYEIKEIVFTSAGTWTATITADGYDSSTKTWTGSATSVLFTGSGSGRCDMSKATIILGEPSSAPTIEANNVNIAYDATGGEIAYTIENEVEGGSVNATTDAEWISFGTSINNSIAFSCEENQGGERTATVTLTYTYGNDTATKEVTVTQAGNPNAPGTENNPYSVAEARAAIDANTGVTGVYAMGIVSQIVTPLNTQYGNITYNISVDGTTTADQLQAYRGKSYNGANFISEDDIKVGDEVVVFGNLKKYNDTYEFDTNNQLVSLNRPVTIEPTIEVGQTTVNVGVEGDTGILTVQYQNIDDVAADVQFYDENGNEVDANYYEVWLTASLGNDNNVNYIAIENYGEARTAYFKVFALVGNDYVYSDMITITQAAYVAPSIATLPFEFNSGRADIKETDGLTQEGLGSDYASEPKLKFDGTGDWLLLQFDEEPGKLSFDIKGNSFSGGTFTVQTSEDGVTFTDLETYTELGNVETKEFDNLGANVRFVKWIYTEKVAGNVGLGNIKLEKPVTTVTVTIKEGYPATTFSCDKALDFTGQNIAAYIITDYDGTTAQVEKVPANTGLYIEGAAGDYQIPVIASADEISGNKLEATDGTTLYSTNTEFYYAYGKQNGAFAFFKMPTTGYTPSAGKAVLKVPMTSFSGAKEMIEIHTGVTGIESIENGTIVNDNHYTVDGKLVKGQPTKKGIYIVNGRKVVVK